MAAAVALPCGPPPSSRCDHLSLSLSTVSPSFLLSHVCVCVCGGRLQEDAGVAVVAFVGHSADGYSALPAMANAAIGKDVFPVRPSSHPHHHTIIIITPSSPYRSIVQEHHTILIHTHTRTSSRCARAHTPSASHTLIIIQEHRTLPHTIITLYHTIPSHTLSRTHAITP